MNKDFEIVVWLMLIVRLGILAAVIWYGISEYRKYNLENKKDDELEE